MNRIAVAGVLLGALGLVVPAQPARAQVSVSVSVGIGSFYNELTPYGQWVDCGYGECWAPRGVASGWQPYTNGEWIYTSYGWTWVSHDPWGGSPYHYGTWAVVGRYGWVWVPGTVWAPSWVTWSYSDRYVGWAPMPPTWTFGSSGYSGSPVVVNEAQYVFVPTNRFVGTNVTTVRVAPQQNAEIFRQSRPATRFEVSGGIVRNVAVPVETIQRATGSRIETREISAANTMPGKVRSGGGKSGHVAIVAPARDMKAARAAQKQPATRESSPKQQQQAHQQKEQPRQHAQQQPKQHAQQQPKQHAQQQPQQHAQQQPQQHAQQQPKQYSQLHQQQPPAAHAAQPGQGHEKAKPAAKEQGKDENKGKKGQSGGEKSK